MRYITFIIILIESIQATAQQGSGRVQPFQVLYAENTKNRLGRAVENLDLIDIDDTLHIQNGTLSLIHHTGFPIEINSDTAIAIQKLHKLIIQDESRKEEKEIHVINHRPYLEFLFTSSKEEGYKKLSHFGACNDCGPSIVSYPPEGLIYYKNGLCINWKHEFRNSYYVTLRNLYDDVIMEFPINTTEISLNSADLSRLKMESDTFLIVFKLRPKGAIKESILIKKYRKYDLELPFPCTPTQATSALIAAFYNDLPGLNNLIDAEKYYILATQLSDRKFYKDMLSNFKSRTEK